MTGFIEPCVGIARGRLPFAAGTVSASRGVERTQRVSPDGYRTVLPTDVGACQHVNENQAFRFVLAPGRYVVTGIYDRGGRPQTFFDVTVLPRMTVHRNLPDLCK
ncbi:MAG: hypothetical protein ACLPVY_16660 [Acidimicrobiia bacterium]